MIPHPSDFHIQLYSGFLPFLSLRSTIPFLFLLIYMWPIPSHFPLSFRIFFSSLKVKVLVTQSRLSLCDPMDRSTPSFPVHHQLLDLTQTHFLWVGDAIQPPHPLSSPSPSPFNLSQHQNLFQWVSSSHQVAKILELQLQHQFFQWTPRTDFL